MTFVFAGAVSEVRLAQIAAAAAPIAAAFRRTTTAIAVPEQPELFDRQVTEPLCDAIHDAIIELAGLEAVLELESGDGRDPLVDLTADALEEQGPPSIVAARPSQSFSVGGSPAEAMWREVADVCFAARGELRRAAHSLGQAGANQDDRLATCEAAHRKLRRALGAVLTALGRAADFRFPALAELDAELASAAAVRRMYAKFRRSLPACDPAEPASVRRALRYAAVSLAVMIGDGGFGEVRTQDRALLLQLQGRILHWARSGGIDGVELYRDIVTAADLLRSINLRPELAAHDQTMLRAAATALAGCDPDAALAAAAPALRALEGRDDALDAILERALREPMSLERLAELRSAVASLEEPLP